MNVRHLMEEYGLSIDDIRWHLSFEITNSLLLHNDSPEDLTRVIWSGELEARLYDLEERFLASLQDELDRGLTDEAAVRSRLETARLRKIHRHN